MDTQWKINSNIFPHSKLVWGACYELNVLLKTNFYDQKKNPQLSSSPILT